MTVLPAVPAALVQDPEQRDGIRPPAPYQQVRERNQHHAAPKRLKKATAKARAWIEQHPPASLTPPDTYSTPNSRTVLSVEETVAAIAPRLVAAIRDPKRSWAARALWPFLARALTCASTTFEYTWRLIEADSGMDRKVAKDHLNFWIEDPDPVLEVVDPGSSATGEGAQWRLLAPMNNLPQQQDVVPVLFSSDQQTGSSELTRTTAVSVVGDLSHPYLDPANDLYTPQMAGIHGWRLSVLLGPGRHVLTKGEAARLLGLSRRRADDEMQRLVVCGRAEREEPGEYVKGQIHPALTCADWFTSAYPSGCPDRVAFLVKGPDDLHTVQCRLANGEWLPEFERLRHDQKTLKALDDGQKYHDDAGEDYSFQPWSQGKQEQVALVRIIGIHFDGHGHLVDEQHTQEQYYEDWISEQRLNEEHALEDHLEALAFEEDRLLLAQRWADEPEQEDAPDTDEPDLHVRLAALGVPFGAFRPVVQALPTTRSGTPLDAPALPAQPASG